MLMTTTQFTLQMNPKLKWPRGFCFSYFLLKLLQVKLLLQHQTLNLEVQY